MAIFDGKNLRGAIGNLVFSKHGKQTIVKSKPSVGGVKQTDETKRSASVFGRYISPFAKQIRMAFTPLHLHFHDGQMGNRMNAAISTIIYQHMEGDGEFNFNQDSFKRLEGFDFNIKAPLNKSLLLMPTVSFSVNKVKVHLPAFSVSKNIRFPANTSCCSLQIQVTTIDIKKRSTLPLQTETILIEKFVSLFEGKDLVFDFEKGELILVGMSLFFSEPKAMNPYSPNGKSFHPAGIISAYFNDGG